MWRKEWRFGGGGWEFMKSWSTATLEQSFQTPEHMEGCSGARIFGFVAPEAQHSRLWKCLCISILGRLRSFSADKHMGDTFSSDIGLFDFLVVQIENYSHEAFHLQQTPVSWQKIETLQAALPGFRKRIGWSADSTWMLAIFCCCLGAWKLLDFFSSTLPYVLNKKMVSCHIKT